MGEISIKNQKTRLMLTLRIGVKNKVKGIKNWIYCVERGVYNSTLKIVNLTKIYN